VKQFAAIQGLLIKQPATLRDPAVQEELVAAAPDILVVVAYGLILPKTVLAIPRYGCINVHASLLPRWRGAAPIQYALLAGDTETGVSIMQMQAGIDTGPVLARQTCPIRPDDTTLSLQMRLATLGAELLLKTLPDMVAGKLHPTPQDNSQATYAPRIEKSMAVIDWSQSTQQLDGFIRAFNPWPVAVTHLDDTPIRIWQARPCTQHHDIDPGTILHAAADGIHTATGDGCLCLTKLQLPGKKTLEAKEILQAKGEFFRVGMRFS
jgi:methionyl-tRNA formyltransferase